MTVFRDVAVDEPNFFAVNRRIALGNRALTVPQRFHFGPSQLNASFEPILDEIVKARASVLSNNFLLVEWVRKRLGHRDELVACSKTCQRLCVMQPFAI